MGFGRHTNRFFFFAALLGMLSLTVGCFGFIGSAPPEPGEGQGTPAAPSTPGTQPPGTQPPGQRSNPPGTGTPTNPTNPGNPTNPTDPPVNPPTNPPTDPPKDPPTDPPTPTANACEVKPALIRRLTREEYKYTLKDVLGYDLDLKKSTLPPDAQSIGFAVALGVGRIDAQAYMDTSESIATTIGFDKLGQACLTTKRDDACAKTWIEEFGAKLYRRPLSAEETSRTVQLYQTMKGKFGFDMAIRVLLQFFLQSPHFLYRYELGQKTPTAEGLTLLKGYEVAVRLSYFLWKSVPDAALYKAAREGKLSTKAEIAAQARRMLNDAKAKRTIHSFFEQWLELEKLDTTSKSKTYPFSPQIAADMKHETLAFVDHVFSQADASFKTLLTAPYTVANKRLAVHYQLKDTSGLTDAKFVKIDRDPTHFSGLLTIGSTMTIHSYADQTSPIHRGIFVRKHLLCHELPSPPNDVEIKAPELNDNMTTRERFEQHRTDPNCNKCHQLVDPIGFGLENYDPVGRYRTHENNKNQDHIDGKGELKLTDDIDGPFTGPVELGQRLATSRQVQECYVRQWYRYAFAQQPDLGGDCFIKAIWSDFQASNFNIRELLVSIASNQFFSCHKGQAKVD